MKTYTPVEVRNDLGIQDSTLRKYSLILEQRGIPFERHKNNRRIYTELHVKTLKRSIELKHSADMTLEEAVIEAIKEIKAHPIIDDNSVTGITPQRHDSDMTALFDEIRSLKEVIVAQEERQKEKDSLFLEALENLQGEIKQLREEREEMKRLAIEERKEKEEQPMPLEEAGGIFSKWFRRRNK